MRALKELAPLLLRFCCELLPLTLQCADTVALVLLPEQLLLHRVVAQKRGQPLVELLFQLVQPGHDPEPGVVMIGFSISSSRGVMAASRDRSINWVKRATAPSPSSSWPIRSNAAM